MNKIRYAPKPRTENKASDKKAPNGPPKFSTVPFCELRLEKLGSTDEYDTSEIKI